LNFERSVLNLQRAMKSKEREREREREETKGKRDGGGWVSQGSLRKKKKNEGQSE
jgi:hypothetical protein